MLSVGLWIAAGVLGAVLYYVFWEVYEYVRPLEYTGVHIDGLSEHFQDLYERGMRGSELLIREEHSGETIRLRKWYYSDVYEPPILLEVVLSSLTPGRADRRAAMAYLKDQNIRVRYGTRRTTKWKKVFPFWAKRNPTTKYKEILVCDCSDSVDMALRITKLAIYNVYGVDGEVSFAVRVVGKISPYACFIRPDMRFRAGSILPGPLAKPYKQWHKTGHISHRLGCCLGRIATRIHELFFPPRGPGDDLRH